MGGGLTIESFPEIAKVVLGVGSYRENMEFITLSPDETEVAAAALIAAGKRITQEDHSG